jgi:hypothetical protein
VDTCQERPIRLDARLMSKGPQRQSDHSFAAWPGGPVRLARLTPARVRPAETKPGLCGRRPGAAQTSPSSVKSPSGGPQTACTPTTHDPPDQDSCRQLRPSGNTTSTEVSPAAATTTAVIVTTKSSRLLQPRVGVGTKIDNACPSHPWSTRNRRPAPAYRCPAKSWVWSHQIHGGQKAPPGGYQLPSPALSDQGVASLR